MTNRPEISADLSERVDTLSRLVAAQQTEIDALRAARHTPGHRGVTDAAVGTPPPVEDRRRFLRRAGAAAVGAASVSVAATAPPAGAAAADPYPQYVKDTGDTITGKLTVTGAKSPRTATEIGNGYGGLSTFTHPEAVELASQDDRPIRIGAQTRWDSDDDGVAGTNLDINTPALVLRQTGENHKGGMIEFQQQLDVGPHEMGIATNTPHAVFDVPTAGPRRVGWITAHYDSPNPVDDIHQHLNFETCKEDLETLITRFQISWGEDVALCSFPNSNVRVVQSGKTLSFGSNQEVRAVHDAAGGLRFSGDPVSFDVGQLRVADVTVRPVLFARKTTDQVVRSSSTLRDDDDLTVHLAADAIHTFTLFLNWSSDAGADLKVGWRLPGDASILWSPDGFGTAATSTTSSPKQSAEGANAVALGGVGTGTRLAFAATGIVRTHATGGWLHLQWAQNSARTPPTTVAADSFLQVVRMS